MRHANSNWNLPDKLESWQQVNSAILMDIRDELRSLNALLRCPNFTGIPRTLRDIKRNTTKRKRRASAR